MSGLVLLIIGLASLALVFAMLGYVGLKAWGVYQRGVQVSRDVGPFADQLSAWSVVVEAKATEVADTGAAIAASVERLQASLQRLQILAAAFNESAAPFRRLLHYLGR